MVADKIESRLNRISGQVEGVKRMYAGERDCLELVQQIAATRQALARVAKDLMTGEAVRCARLPHKQEDFDRVIKTLFDIS